MATNPLRPVADHLRQAAAGIPDTARGRLMAEAAEALDEKDRVIDELRGSIPPEGWLVVNPQDGPTVFYLAIDGTLYQLDDTYPGTIEPARERMVARALLQHALDTTQEADRG